MSYNVLVVDDSSIVRQMVIRTINMSGLEIGTIHEAGNGREALQVMENEWVDIVFADLHMPEMNGIEMVEKMSEDNLLVSIPVVIVSSDHSQARIDELKKRGIRAYMKKPFRPEGLRDVIADVLGTVGGNGNDS
jgi:two-component system chemotaxis response regulator CheY